MSFFLALNLLAMRSNIFFCPLNDVLLQAFTTTVVVAVVANAILNSGYSVPNAKEKCLRRIVSISAEMRKTAFGLLFGLSLPTLEFYELFFSYLNVLSAAQVTKFLKFHHRATETKTSKKHGDFQLFLFLFLVSLQFH